MAARSGAHGHLGWAVLASLQTDSPGLLPQNKKAKERGFFISCLATQAGKKQSETWKQARGWGGVCRSGGPRSPAVRPQGRLDHTQWEPGPLGKRGTGKAWRVEQLGAQIGTRRPQPMDASCLVLAQEAPPRRGRRAPPCRVGASGSRTARAWPPGGCAHAAEPAWARGQALSQGVRWRGVGGPGSPQPTSPRKPPEPSRSLSPLRWAPFSHLAS